MMARITELQEKYERLTSRLTVKKVETIDDKCLLAFDYEYPDQPSEVTIETEEFTAVCPWTGLPDIGKLTITYVPHHKCVELKSLKHYILTFRDVGIVQEHVANKILKDLTTLCQPRSIKIHLDYKARGGMHTSVIAEYKAE